MASDVAAIDDPGSPPVGHAALLAALERIPMGVVLIDAGLRYRWFNPAAARLTGGRIAAAVGRTVAETAMERHGPEVATRVTAAFAACLADGRPRREPAWPMAEPGEPPRRLAAELNRITVEDGAPALLLTLVDADEQRLRWLVDHTTEAMWRFELEPPLPVALAEDEQLAWCARWGRFTDANLAMARQHGLAATGDIVGRRLGEILTLDDPQNREVMRAFVRSGYRLIDAETAGRDGEGRHRFFLTNLVAQVVEGRVAGGWGSCRDITAYREAVAATRETEDRLRLAVDAAEVGTWDYDPATGVMTWSERLKALFGLAAAEPAGRDEFFARMHPDDRERVRRAVMQVVTGGDVAGFDDEFRVVTAAGTRWIAAKGRMAVAGGAPRFLGAATDVSRQKLAEEELARKARALERSNAELEQFAYIASHDLQEPLRMITSYLQLLQKRYASLFDDKAREYFGFATGGAERMRAMIQAVLEYSRVGRRDGAVVELDAGEAVRDALDNLRAPIAAARARIEVGPLPRVRADPIRLTQLFQNLIGNAIKFAKPGVPPVVRVEVVEGACEHVFRVIDDGIGIAAESQERIFMIFQRVHTPDEYPGSGIGLATSKKIVERLGGRIWVESRPGEGSTFSFSLPR